MISTDKDIFDKLVECGLPATHNPTDTSRNRQSGKVYIFNICPDVTLEIIKNLNGEKVSDRRIIVTPIMETQPREKSSPLSPVREPTPPTAAALCSRKSSSDLAPALVASDNDDEDMRDAGAHVC